jgi:signal transduction histidine kinase
MLDRVAPRAVTEGAVALVEHRFANAEVLISAEIADDLPMIRGDQHLLEQALVNLLLNACDACQPGGHVAIAVSADTVEVTFKIIDDGSGISAANAARVLEPFFSTKPAEQGTGLGLAIASEIVKIHRGTLTLSAGSPRGTEAFVRVPITPRGDDAVA